MCLVRKNVPVAREYSDSAVAAVVLDNKGSSTLMRSPGLWRPSKLPALHTRGGRASLTSEYHSEAPHYVAVIWAHLLSEYFLQLVVIIRTLSYIHRFQAHDCVLREDNVTVAL